MIFRGIVDYATSYAALLVHNKRGKSHFDNELTKDSTINNLGSIGSRSIHNKMANVAVPECSHNENSNKN